MHAPPRELLWLQTLREYNSLVTPLKPMNKTRLLQAAAALFLMVLTLAFTGCVNPAVSLRPLQASDEKPVAEPGMEGKWLMDEPSSEEAKNWEISRDANGCYRVQAHKDPARESKIPRTETYSTCLVRMQDKLFFDSELLTKQMGGESVSPSDLGAGVVRAHVIGRIWLQKDVMRVARLDSEWVEKNTPESFRMMEGKAAVITASTADLRKLLLEHGDDDALWGKFAYLCRPEVDCAARANADRLARYPDKPEVLQKAAVFYLGRREDDKALELMRHAVQVAPNESGSHAYLALTLGARGDLAGTRGELQQAQQLDKENPGSYDVFVAMTYYLEGNYQEASRIFARIHTAEKQPSATPILMNYFSLALAGRRKEADAYLARESARFTGSAEDHLLLLEATGRVTNPPWAKMADGEKNDDLFMYAEYCLVKGDMKSARAVLEYIARKPGDDDLINQIAARIQLDQIARKMPGCIVLESQPTTSAENLQPCPAGIRGTHNPGKQ
jgi:Flp pilus assembly protein TadD